jgi:hypothetical protein
MKLQSILLLGACLSLQAMAEVPADSFLGDWKGSVKLGSSQKEVTLCMIPLGNDRYEARFFEELGKQDQPLFFITGTIKGDSDKAEIKFLDNDALSLDKVQKAVSGGVVLDANLWSGTISKGNLNGVIAGKQEGSFTFKKTTRTSPTIGLKPPEGAVVLFDGTEKSKENFIEHGNNQAIRWEIKEGGALEVNGGNIIPKKGFGDCTLHLEFRSPFYPDRFGQARGNSGVYINGAYELQVLDSYGLPGWDNECGGIYQISRPAVNACFPPMQWQTYDIDFTMPRFDAEGKKVKNGRVTIKLNGTAIHQDLELPKATAGAINPSERDLVGFLLQDHGDKVQFRNIWVLEK